MDWFLYDIGLRHERVKYIQFTSFVHGVVFYDSFRMWDELKKSEYGSVEMGVERGRNRGK